MIAGGKEVQRERGNGERKCQRRREGYEKRGKGEGGMREKGKNNHLPSISD